MNCAHIWLLDFWQPRLRSYTDDVDANSMYCRVIARTPDKLGFNSLANVTKGLRDAYGGDFCCDSTTLSVPAWNLQSEALSIAGFWQARLIS
jgi:hypothetical protein